MVTSVVIPGQKNLHNQLVMAFTFVSLYNNIDFLLSFLTFTGFPSIKCLLNEGQYNPNKVSGKEILLCETNLPEFKSMSDLLYNINIGLENSMTLRTNKVVKKVCFQQ